MIKRTLVIRRSGIVTTEKCSPNQCKEQGWKSYDYLVEIRCGECLDEEGFLIDNNVIHKVIQDLFAWTIGSCEEMCVSSCKMLARALKQHETDWSYISVQIRATGGITYMECIDQRIDVEEAQLFPGCNIETA